MGFIDEVITFWLYFVTFAGVLIAYVVRKLSQLFITDRYLTESKKLQLKINQAKAIIQELPDISSKNVQQNISNKQDITGMTFEQAAESFGLEPKDYNNPIIRPMLEKMYANMLKEQVGSGEGEIPGF